MTAAQPRVMIACGGVGIAQRGFETVARETFEALRGRDDLAVVLVKGRGRPSRAEFVAPTVRRDGRSAAALGRALGRDPYWVEQVAFAAALVPLIAVWRPDVIYVSEWSVSRALAKWRRLSGARFHLLLSNGGPYPPDWIDHVDHIHQVTPTELERAVKAGFPRERQTLLEHGMRFEPFRPVPSTDERAALRRRLRLPEKRPIVLAVAALAIHHKRLDFLVGEVASLPEPRPHLVMLGQREAETPALLELAHAHLGAGGFTARTVPRRDVPLYYRAADVFAHVSLWEAFGLVMVEAMSHGLSCLVHDGPTQRFVLGEHGTFGDLTASGGLATLLPRALEARDGPRAAAAASYVRERFAWDRLAPRYAEMMRAAAGTPRSAGGGLRGRGA